VGTVTLECAAWGACERATMLDRPRSATRAPNGTGSQWVPGRPSRLSGGRGGRRAEREAHRPERVVDRRQEGGSGRSPLERRRQQEGVVEERRRVARVLHGAEEEGAHGPLPGGGAGTSPTAVGCEPPRRERRAARRRSRSDPERGAGQRRRGAGGRGAGPGPRGAAGRARTTSRGPRPSRAQAAPGSARPRRRPIPGSTSRASPRGGTGRGARARGQRLDSRPPTRMVPASTTAPQRGREAVARRHEVPVEVHGKARFAVAKEVLEAGPEVHLPPARLERELWLVAALDEEPPGFPGAHLWNEQVRGR